MEWSRSRRVHYVYRQRVKILRPDVHQKQKKRATYRSGITGRRKTLRGLRLSITKLQQEIVDAEVNAVMTFEM